jgi:LysR family hydrogen peroxide-inducible transcriptional activator
MNFRNLSFRDLQFVVAVAEFGSFSRGAEACAITQPALSERIKRIESDLDVELFERNKRALIITPVGEKLIRKARKLLDEAADIGTIVSSSRDPLSGPFRVGILTTLGPYLMPLVLPRLRQQYPNLELLLQEDLTEPLVESLQAGSIDVVIAAAPIHASGLDQLELFDEPFILAIPVDHKFADRKEIHTRDLCGDDMVLLEDGHCLSGQALDVCPTKQRRNRHRLHAMTLETLRHMVATGAGYTLLPSLAVGEAPPLTDLIRYRPLAGKRQYGRKIVMVWRKSYRQGDSIRLLADVIGASLPTKLQQ